MSVATATLKAVIKADGSGFVNSIKDAVSNLGTLDDQMYILDQGIEHFKTRFIAEFAAVTAALGFATYQADQFDDAVRDVFTLVDENKTGLGELSDNLLTVAGNLKDDPALVASAHYQVLSAGVSDLSESFKVLETSGKLGKGGIGTTFEAVDLLTTAINSYGKTSKDVNSISDQFMVTVKEGKTTIGQLAGGFGKVAPLAKQAGLGMEELNAATATLTKGGIPTAEAFTAIRGILQALVAPTEKAKKKAKELGLDFSLAALKSKGFAKFLDDVKEKTQGNSESTSKLFGNIQGLTGVLALGGDDLKEYTKILNKLKDSTGETEKGFKKQLQPTKVFAKNLKILSVIIGTKLLPFINALLTPINKLFDVFHNLNPFLKDTIVYTGIIASILAPFRYILLFLGVAGGRLVGLIPKLLAGIRFILPWIARSIPLLLRLLGLSNPLGWAIMAIIVVIQILRHNVAGVTDVITKAYKVYVGALSEIINAIYPVGDLMQWVGGSLSALWEEIQLIFNAIIETIRNILQEELHNFIITVEQNKNKILLWIAIIKEYIAQFIVFVTNVINAIKKALSDFWDFIKEWSANLFDTLNVIFLGAPEGIQGIIDKVKELTQALIDNEKFMNMIGAAFEIGLNGSLPGFSKAFDFFKKFSKKKEELRKQGKKDKEEEKKQDDENTENTLKNLGRIAGERKKNSDTWLNWLKEMQDGMKNRSKALGELLQKQPNYGVPLSGGVSSTRPSGLYDSQSQTGYHFHFGNDDIYLPGPKNPTAFERDQAYKEAKRLYDIMRKKKSGGGGPPGGPRQK